MMQRRNKIQNDIKWKLIDEIWPRREQLMPPKYIPNAIWQPINTSIHNPTNNAAIAVEDAINALTEYGK